MAATEWKFVRFTGQVVRDAHPSVCTSTLVLKRQGARNNIGGDITNQGITLNNGLVDFFSINPIRIFFEILGLLLWEAEAKIGKRNILKWQGSRWGIWPFGQQAERMPGDLQVLDQVIKVFQHFTLSFFALKLGPVEVLVCQELKLLHGILQSIGAILFEQDIMGCIVPGKVQVDGIWL